MNINIRQATRKELAIAVDWAAKEGWNPGLHDADVFWATDPEGYLVLEVDSQVIGTVSGVSYNRKFGFAGFFIVKEEFRKKGLGTQFAEYLFNFLKSRLEENAAIGIDGVFAMQPTYAKWGFEFSHRNLRMEGVGKKFEISDNVNKIATSDFEKIHKLDTECFGFDRETFLDGWLSLPDIYKYKYITNGQLKGFGVIRKCVTGWKIGPLFAENYEVADELYKALANSVPDEAIFLDVPEINKDAIKLAAKYKMQEMFGCARMYKGKAPYLSYNKIFGVTTFELG